MTGGPGWLRVALPGWPHPAVIAALPYPSEARLGRALRDSLEEAPLRAEYSARVGLLLAQAAEHFGAATVNLVVGHLYAAGGLESDSERPIQVGGAYTVDAAAFPASAHYVALGHPHRPQIIPGSVPVRYAGSPLALSFSEAGQAKGLVLVDVVPGGCAAVRELPLRGGHPLVLWRAGEGVPQVRGWVEAGRDPGAWIDLEVHVQQPLSQAEIGALRQLPVEFVHIRPVLTTAPEVPAARARRGLPVDELFRLFYRRSTGGDPSPAVARLFAELLAQGPGEGESA